MRSSGSGRTNIAAHARRSGRSGGSGGSLHSSGSSGSSSAGSAGRTVLAGRRARVVRGRTGRKRGGDGGGGAGRQRGGTLRGRTRRRRTRRGRLRRRFRGRFRGRFSGRFSGRLGGRSFGRRLSGRRFGGGLGGRRFGGRKRGGRSGRRYGGGRFGRGQSSGGLGGWRRRGGGNGLAELGEDELSLETLIALRDRSDGDGAVDAHGVVVGAGVIVARSIRIHAEQIAEIALRVGENHIAGRGQHETLVLAFVVLRRTLRNRRIAVQTLPIIVRGLAFRRDESELRHALDSHEAAPMDRRQTQAVHAAADLTRAADEALVHLHHRRQNPVHTAAILFHAHVLREDARRRDAPNSIERARAISRGGLQTGVRHAAAIVALHTRSHGEGIGNNAPFAGHVVVGVGVVDDLALVGDAGGSGEGAAVRRTIRRQNELVVVAAVAVLGLERDRERTLRTDDVRGLSVLALLVVVGALRCDDVLIAIHTTNAREGAVVATTLVARSGVHLHTTVAVGSNSHFLRGVPLAIITLAEITSTLCEGYLPYDSRAHDFILDTS